MFGMVLTCPRRSKMKLRHICMMVLFYDQYQNALSKCFLIQCPFSWEQRDNRKISRNLEATNSILVWETPSCKWSIAGAERNKPRRKESGARESFVRT